MENEKDTDTKIVFFIDKQQFKTDRAEISAGNLLSEFAQEDPTETTLVLKHGNELTKFEDDNQLITLHNGMHFVVFFDGPTTVSAYGPDQLIHELHELGYKPKLVKGADNQLYAVISGYVVELGKFAGRVIDLAIPAMPNFPQAVSSSIHVRAKPQLYEKHDSVANIRNVIDSGLGQEWLYWSKNFNWGRQKQTARRLMALIAGVFKNA